MFSMVFHRNSWKTLARPMFSMNFWFFLDSWLIPGDSLENHKFMANIGQANVFHGFFTGIHGQHWPGQCFPWFFHRNSWKTLARPMFFMNFWFFLDSWLIPGDSLETHKFMKNIGEANAFHGFFTGIHGKHWPGQCFP